MGFTRVIHTRWTGHGELLGMSSFSQRKEVDLEMVNLLEDMIRDIGQECFKRTRYMILCEITRMSFCFQGLIISHSCRS